MTLAAVTGVLGALGNQSRPAGSAPVAVPRQDNSSIAIATALSDKRAKQAGRNADKERLMSLLQDPAVIGMLTMLAGLYMAERIPWSGDKNRDNLIRSLAITGVLLVSLGRAGVGDTTTAAIAVAAGAGSLAEGILGNVDVTPEVQVPGTGLEWSPWTGILGNLWK